jgi:hypothetical protein
MGEDGPLSYFLAYKTCLTMIGCSYFTGEEKSIRSNLRDWRKLDSTYCKGVHLEEGCYVQEVDR